MKKVILYIIPFFICLSYCNSHKSPDPHSAIRYDTITTGNQQQDTIKKTDTNRTAISNRAKSQLKTDKVIRASSENKSIPKNAIYIDPGFSGTERGTEDHPYKSLDKINWNDNIYVVIKRGSEIITNSTIRPDGNNITIGAYGEGNRPKIKSLLKEDKKIIDLGGLENATVRDIEIESVNEALTCFHFNESKGATLINCKVHGSQWGIRNLNSSGTFRIINCEVSNTGDDGVFIRNVDTVEVSGSHIFNVNQKYFINTSEKFSGGDCLQLFDVKYFKILNNNLDHGSTGNKFCFISNGENNRSGGIIEKNILSRNGSGILIYLDQSDNVIIRQNHFNNAEIALYNHSANAKIYYNEFVNISENVLMINSKGYSTETQVFNNTFVNFGNLANDYKEDVLFVNNIFYKNSGTMFSAAGKVKPEYNCYYEVKNIKDINDTNSIFADPLFKNAEKLDFSLKENSPCIDKGKTQRGKYFDINGNKVPAGNAFDIGAHEYLQ